jgi:hypothetical protein
VTLLIRPHLTANSPALVRAFSISLTVFPRARKAILSANDKVVISGFTCSILLNIPLKYILNRIGETGEPYRTPAFISCN